jgi:lycopene cyclase domain-containing protein
MGYLYFLINILTIAYPLAQSFEHRLHYHRKWRALFPAILLTGSFFIIWDIWFTQKGIWGFNDNYLIGFRLWNLPLEEWLFFITVPFASVFIYECVWYFFPRIKNFRGLQAMTLGVGIMIISIAFMHSNQTYTYYNFLFAGIMTLIVGFWYPNYLAKFWVAYLFHLIPFLIVNGILTGSLIEEPIVWYNDNEIFGIRIKTIPIEDTIYSLLLLMMNIALFEYFLKKTGPSRTTQSQNS